MWDLTCDGATNNTHARIRWYVYISAQTSLENIIFQQKSMCCSIDYDRGRIVLGSRYKSARLKTIIIGHKRWDIIVLCLKNSDIINTVISDIQSYWKCFIYL